MSEKLDYYSFDKVYSYNATYMFIVGARGLGKTYGAKQRVIRNFIRTGEQFIYLRRYKPELTGRGTFFADIMHEFPDYDFRVNGHVAECAPVSSRNEKKREWSIMGYFVALSTAQSQKSIAYPRVTTIIFDEFIIEKGALRYLPDEAKAFNDFFSTVDRWKDKTRVLFLANAISIMNPYFLDYDIKVNEKTGEFVKVADGFIVAHFPDSAKFATGVYRTKFGQFIAGTDYAEYSVGSEFGDNHERMIALKPSNAKYYYTLETRNGTFSVWVDIMGPYYYIQDKRPKQENIYTLVAQWMDEDKTLMLPSDRLAQMLRSAFRAGKMWFSSPQARNAFIDVLKR